MAQRFRDAGGANATRLRENGNDMKAIEMRKILSLRSRGGSGGVSVALLAAGLLAGCVSEQSSTESLYRQNMVSETALNAQIMSDRARDQRCQRDPSRRECGPRP